MNCIVFFKDELQGDGFIVVTGPRVEYIKEWHSPVEGVEISAGIWGGKLGSAKVLQIKEKEIHFQFSPSKDSPQKKHVAIVSIPRPQTIKKVLHNSVALGLKELHFVLTKEVVPGYVNSKFLRENPMRDEILKALEQTCDTIPPAVEVHSNWNYFVKEKLPHIARGLELFCADTFAHEKMDNSSDKQICIAIGPEAGWHASEREIFRQSHFKFISLGERMLRVDQALMRAIPQLV